jgi:hypothetical protein
MRRFITRVAFLAPFFASSVVMAQQNIETCPSVPIVPQPKPTDMTKRLNDDLDCLWRKVQTLEREVDRLKQEQATKGQTSPSLSASSAVQASIPPPSNNAVVEGGIEVTADGIFLSSDRKTISANVSLKNTNDDDVLVMIVGTESTFVIQNMLIKASIVADGIANCTPHAGNSASTWLCLHDDDIRWSNLNRDIVYKTHLTSTLDRPVIATIADINLHLLIKIGGKAKAYDAPINGIDIK